MTVKATILDINNPDIDNNLGCYVLGFKASSRTTMVRDTVRLIDDVTVENNLVDWSGFYIGPVLSIAEGYLTYYLPQESGRISIRFSLRARR